MGDKIDQSAHYYIAHYCEEDKKSQTVEEHLLGVASRARDYADTIGLGALGEILGLLHDLGKFSDEFQIYIKKVTGFCDEDIDYDEN